MFCGILYLGHFFVLEGMILITHHMEDKMLEKFFKLKENGTTVKTEVIAGITTFMTMP